MYDISWNSKSIWSKNKNIDPIKWQTKLNLNNVEYTSNLHWVEHCLECAPPTCYEICQLYKKREDNRCVRFDYGIIKNKSFNGILSYGADIRFRKWAKLESQLTLKPLRLKTHKKLDKISHFLTKTVTVISRIIGQFTNNRIFNIALNHYREKLILNSSLKYNNYNFDYFVFECYSCENYDFNIFFEVLDGNKLLFKHSFKVSKKHNFYKIPFEKFTFNKSANHRIRIYPENDLTARIILTALDFIKEKNIKSKPSKKVKCLVWDLDNTLWSGIFTEDGEENIKFKKNIFKVIKQLDDRGIIQSIVSKNNSEDIIPFLKKNQIDHYFLYSKINWSRKSENIKKISRDLNIGLESVAFIDDSIFERNEVKSSLPMVRIYNESEYLNLLDLNEFDVQITDLSKKRRLSYQKEIIRKSDLAEFEDSYDEFLRSCMLNVEIFKPSNKNEINRCYELVQRSNQLNLSTRRYTEDEFKDLLNDNNVKVRAIRCSDKYGDYGIVGFSSIFIKHNDFILNDFVISCRVARKKVEETFFQKIAQEAIEKNVDNFYANFKITSKNGPLSQIFDDLPFEKLNSDNNVIRYKYLLKKNKVNNIIKVSYYE